MMWTEVANCGPQNLRNNYSPPIAVSSVLTTRQRSVKTDWHQLTGIKPRPRQQVDFGQEWLAIGLLTPDTGVYILCIEETWDFAFLHWQQGKYQLWGNFFPEVDVNSEPDPTPEFQRHVFATHYYVECTNYSAITSLSKIDCHQLCKCSVNFELTQSQLLMQSVTKILSKFKSFHFSDGIAHIEYQKIISFL